MKYLISLFVLFMTFQTSFASDLEVPQNNWGFMPQPVYDIVPTRQERLEDPDNFTRFPGWEDMEIVRHEVINRELADRVNTKLWNEDISMYDMRDLVLQAFDILTKQIAHRCGYSIVPFAADIRYREAGMDGITNQGTINSFGAIQFIFEDQNKVQDIRILVFDDSQKLERFGRSIGTINQYNIDFIKSIVYPLLKNYLSKDENKGKFEDLFGELDLSGSC